MKSYKTESRLIRIHIYFLSCLSKEYLFKKSDSSEMKLSPLFWSKLQFCWMVVNYFKIFSGGKTASKYPLVNSLIFELRSGEVEQFTTFTNNLNIAPEYIFRYI